MKVKAKANESVFSALKKIFSVDDKMRSEIDNTFDVVL